MDHLDAPAAYFDFQKEQKCYVEVLSVMRAAKCQQSPIGRDANSLLLFQLREIRHGNVHEVPVMLRL